MVLSKVEVIRPLGLTLDTQATQDDIEGETNENTYIPPDLMQHVPGVGRVAHLDAQVNIDNSTTLTNLSGFAWTTGANENFGGIFSGRLGINDDPDMKFTFTGPTGAGMRCQWFLYDTAGNLESAGTANTLGTGAAVTTSEGTTGAVHHLIIYISCNAEDTAGTFQFQWAQNSSHANAISVFLRTWMTVHKVPE